MGSTDLVTPITFSNGDNVELGHDNGSLDGTLDFLVAFPSETDVVRSITDNGESFEAGSLTGLGLFLDRLDFHDFFLKLFAQEFVNDLGLLDGDGEPEDIVDVVNLLGLDESSELGDRGPGDLIFLSFSLRASLFVSGFPIASSFSSSPETSFSSLSLILAFFWLGLLFWWFHGYKKININ